MNFCKILPQFMYRAILVPKSINFLVPNWYVPTWYFVLPHSFVPNSICNNLVSFYIHRSIVKFITRYFQVMSVIGSAEFGLDPDCMLKPGQYCHGPRFHGSKYALAELIVDRMGYGPKWSSTEVGEVRRGCSINQSTGCTHER